MISLSLCMIVKNEEAVLDRILKPVSQVMDAILIADTGSSRSSIRRRCLIFLGVMIFLLRVIFFWKKSAPITGCGWMRMMSWMKKIWKN